MDNHGIVILAAGNSSRMGQPKQLLEIDESNLITHIINSVIKVKSAESILILGANAALIFTAINTEQIQIVINNNWGSGMASGICLGLQTLLHHNPALETCTFVVCDQPFVNSNLLELLITKHRETGKGIIACSYADTVGTPVLFSAVYFSQLLRLHGEQGAKRILSLHGNDVSTVSFEAGAVDIDTPQDYEHFLKTKSN